eukprot:4523958-Amphidinium_carterae.1
MAVPSKKLQSNPLLCATLVCFAALSHAGPMLVSDHAPACEQVVTRMKTGGWTRTARGGPW